MLSLETHLDYRLLPLFPIQTRGEKAILLYLKDLALFFILKVTG